MPPAKRTPAKNSVPVPALVNTPSLDLDSDDVALPRIYIGHYQSKQVQDDDAEVVAGDIYSAYGEEDMEPILLWSVKKKGDNPGLLVHVLGLKKGKSLSEEGDLQTWAFNDPSAPAEAWTTYDYLVCLPEHDDTTPHKLLFTRTKTAAAKQINTLLKKNEGQGPAWNLAFRIGTAPRENDKGKYFVPQIKPAEATDEAIATSSVLAGMVASSTPQIEAPKAAVEPAI